MTIRIVETFDTPRPDHLPVGGFCADWHTVEHPLAQLSNGMMIRGTFDSDGAASCTILQDGENVVFCGNNGFLSGEWAGTVFELTPEQLAMLVDLFRSGMLPALATITAQFQARYPHTDA